MTAAAEPARAIGHQRRSPNAQQVGPWLLPARAVPHAAALAARVRLVRQPAATAGARSARIDDPTPDPTPPSTRSCPRSACEQIKERLAAFLRDELKLELYPDKTLVTHAGTGAARFLGYEITIQPQRHEDHPSSPDGERRSCAAGAARCDQGEVRPFLRRGKPAQPPATEQPRRLRPSSPPSGPSTGASSSTTCSPPTSTGCSAVLGHGDLDAQDPGRKAPLVGVEDGRQAQGHGRDAARATHLLRSPGRTRRQAATGRTVRRHTAPAAEDAAVTDRPRPGDLPASRSWSPGSSRHLRALPGNGRGARPPRPQALRARQPGAAPAPWATAMAKRRRKTLVVCAACHDPSTPGTPPQRSRSSHWRAGCPESDPSVRGGPPEKDQPSRHLAAWPTHPAWHNGFNRFQRCYERREKVINAFFDLADAIITVRSLIRQAWITHRWDNRRP